MDIWHLQSSIDTSMILWRIDKSNFRVTQAGTFQPILTNPNYSIINKTYLPLLERLNEQISFHDIMIVDFVLKIENPGYVELNIDKFIDEGLSTFMAGSGKYNYEWHRNKLNKFLDENKDFNIAEHTDAFERIYFENETPAPCLASALIIERTLRKYGKDKLIELLKSEKELWTSLKIVGLTKENINNELRKQIKLPLTAAWQ